MTENKQPHIEDDENKIKDDIRDILFTHLLSSYDNGNILDGGIIGGYDCVNDLYKYFKPQADRGSDAEAAAEKEFPLKERSKYKDDNEFDYCRYKIYDKREGFIAGAKWAKGSDGLIP